MCTLSQLSKSYLKELKANNFFKKKKKELKAIKIPRDQMSLLLIYKWSFDIRATLKNPAKHVQFRATNIRIEGNREKDRLWSQIFIIFSTKFIDQLTVCHTLLIRCWEYLTKQNTKIPEDEYYGMKSEKKWEGSCR